MEVDWTSLRRLRDAFLQGTAGEADYWQAPAVLHDYDATFAQRIGWKWDFVLNDLRQLGWRPPSGAVLDWGCGSGVAGRAFLDHFGVREGTELWLHDRSAMAVEFAANRAREKYPDLPINRGLPARIDLLLVSHVLTELDAPRIEQLVTLGERATAVLWVEPGTFETSRALIAVRECWRNRFRIVAPCPHQQTCGVLAAGCEGHWCHQFAKPPKFVFTDPLWTRFSQALEIDLRSLPLSYLAVDRRPAPPLPPNAVRLLGRPRVFKPHIAMLGCRAGGLVEAELHRREQPEDYRRLKKEPESLQFWELDGRRLVLRLPVQVNSANDRAGTGRPS